MSEKAVMPEVPKRLPKLWRWLRRLAVASLLLLLTAMIFVRWVAGVPTASIPVQQTATTTAQGTFDELTVVTVNCAHGRADGWHQMLTSAESLTKNCRSIGRLLKNSKADIAALQECDAPSWWSGRMAQAKVITESASMSHFAESHHVDGAGLHYGTALVSRLHIDNAQAITFGATPPTFSKGFTVATMTWPADPEIHVDVVSVHLDFASAAARRTQVLTMIDVLRERDKPLIIAGDFNSDWSEGSAVRQLAEALQLTTFQPKADLVTFPATGRRLDWILVSSEFEITDLQVLETTVSDHWPVRATIRRKPVPTDRDV